MATGPYFYVQDITYQQVPFAVRVTLTSGEPCHLYGRVTRVQPLIHDIPVYKRGTYQHGERYFCFVAYWDIEQFEPGDTLKHTFYIGPLYDNQTVWFYFYGTGGGAISPSTTGWYSYTYHGELTPQGITRAIAADPDDCAVKNPVFFSCPSWCVNQVRFGKHADNEGWGMGLRFQDIQIPQFATIFDAYLLMRANTDRQGWVRANISCELVDNAPDFSTDTYASFMGRYANRTMPMLDYQVRVPWVDGHYYYTPSFDYQLRLVLWRPGWTPGNSIVVFLEDFAKRTVNPYTLRQMASYNALPDYPVTLAVTWTI